MHKCSTLSSAPECNVKIEKPIDGRPGKANNRCENIERTLKLKDYQRLSKISEDP